MNDLILSELVSAVLSNEAPSSVILCCIVIYILVMLKGFRKDIKDLTLDVHLIKDKMGINSNVIELSSNKKSDKSRD